MDSKNDRKSMNNWLKMPKEERIELFSQIGVQTNLPPQAIEKDAWVTLILRMIFTSDLAEHFIFKGGTSLSKAFHLIERFSEDIDLGINREYLGFGGELKPGQIRKLSKASHTFVSIELADLLRKQLEDYGVDSSLYELNVENTQVSDQDPETIKVNYQSVFPEISYLPQRVLIEVSARSLIEPHQKVVIQSLIDEQYPDANFSEGGVIVNATNPQKTFLEKLILLHEEFEKPLGKIRHLRMSRHFYDLGKILDSEFGKDAIQNKALFNGIIQHRKVFTPVKSTNYDGLTMQNLNIIPPDDFINKYETDYKEMQESMIQGESLKFEVLLEKISSALK